MRPFRFVGHSWKPPEGELPMLIQAAEVNRTHVGLSGCIRHPCWVLDYTYSPAGSGRIGGEEKPWLERPALRAHLYPPGTPYWEDTRPVGGQLHSAYILFRGGKAEVLERLIAATGWARISDPDRLLGDLLAKIASVGQSWGDPGFWKAQALFFDVLHLLAAAAPDPVEEGLWRISGATQPASLPELATAVREYLGRRLGEKVTIREIAKACNVSISTLTHRYRLETGETPMQTLIRMRISAARDLISRGARLKNVAAQLGFCDIYHLSKAFKRHAGMSPREWKKMQHGD